MLKSIVAAIFECIALLLSATAGANSIFGSAAATLEYARQGLMRESIFLIIAIGVGMVMPAGLALFALWYMA